MTMAEVHIISTQTVKPSSKELEPFKLSLLDQLIPPSYVPTIFFYTQTYSSSDTAQISAQLKTSLSETLNHFYPISGRARDNLFIDSYYEGVPYSEARVKCCLSDYLQHVEIEEMNQLLPGEPFCYHPDPTAPLLAVRVTTFSCGGIALALCASHKIFDASTAYAFLRSWSDFSRGSKGEIPRPDLLTASSQLFPPAQRIPPNASSLMKRLWFNEARRRTRIFVFDEKSINSLKFIVKSKNLEHPTRFQALTSFIWKHAMLASRSASGISKPSVCINSVNMRRRLEPQLPDYSIGNMSWDIVVPYTSADDDDSPIELQNLAYLMKEAMDTFYNHDLDILRSGTKEYVFESLNALEKLVSGGDVQIFFFASWLNFMGFHELDFGWGVPCSHRVPGVVSPAYFNLTIFKETGQNKSVEAWITLEEATMAKLERDPEFLAFASPNPHSHLV
ncbi:hypothetical protein PTKIN_Ptkin06aG0019300 [Pterospermum kingtungense]